MASRVTWPSNARKQEHSAGAEPYVGQPRTSVEIDHEQYLGLGEHPASP